MVNIASHHEHGTPDDLTFHTILQEHYLTQQSLSDIQINDKAMHPSNIKNVDKVLIPEDLKRDVSKPLLIHVIGMPKAGKSEMMSIIEELQKITNSVQAVKEAAEPIKKIVDDRTHGKRLDYSYLVTLYSVANITQLGILLKKSHAHENPGILVVERGITDMVPFTRSHFLFGRLDIRKFNTSMSNMLNGLNYLDRFNNAAILMLVNPEESLQREGERKEYGRVMNPPFLRLLYEQYLRFHSETTRDLSLPYTNISIPYACINTSGGHDAIEKNQMLFVNTFNGIVEAYYK